MMDALQWNTCYLPLRDGIVDVFVSDLVWLLFLCVGACVWITLCVCVCVCVHGVQAGPTEGTWCADWSFCSKHH